MVKLEDLKRDMRVYQFQYDLHKSIGTKIFNYQQLAYN